MAKYDTAKLLVLKDNIDRYLRKMEADKYSKTVLQKILSGVEEGERVNKDLAGFLKDLKNSISEVVKFTHQGLTETAKAIEGLNKSISTGYSSKEIVMGLNRLEKLLSKKEKQAETKDRTNEIIKAIKGIKIEVRDIEFPDTIDANVVNFPPQKIAQPVSHISINSLSGTVHQTTTTVTTTLTTLPGYGVLDNRRSLIFYNNDSDNTIFIGGSTVTTSTGFPVEAKSYSPSFDSGPLQRWYGVTSTGTAEVRTLEIPDEASGR